MEYKILFYSLVAIFLIIAVVSLITFKKGGSTSILPITGVGLMFLKTRSQVYDPETESIFISNKITLALIFIFIIFEWGEDNEEPDTTDDETKLAFDGN